MIFYCFVVKVVYCYYSALGLFCEMTNKDIVREKKLAFCPLQTLTQITSLKEIKQILHSSIWSHKRLLLNTFKQNSMCKIKVPI